MVIKIDPEITERKEKERGERQTDRIERTERQTDRTQKENLVWTQIVWLGQDRERARLGQR